MMQTNLTECAQIVSFFKIVTQNHEISDHPVQRGLILAGEIIFKSRTSSKGNLILKMRFP